MKYPAETPMNRRVVPFSQIRVQPVSSKGDWRVAQLLVSELIAWLSTELRLDAAAAQEGAQAELADMASYYAFPRGIFLLGRVDDHIAGTAGIRLLDNETAELKRVWVSPRHRGKGLAQVLLARALDSARALGATRVVLETDPIIMAKAVQMCREQGFREAAAYSTLPERVPSVLTMAKRVA